MNRIYTDKEHMEFAAKAAGLNLIKWMDGAEYGESMFDAEVPVEGREEEYPGYWSEEGWNPLVYDHDNRKLQISLNISLNRVGIGWEASFQHYRAHFSDEDYGGSIAAGLAAARRAVVYVASLMGRNMENSK